MEEKESFTAICWRHQSRREQSLPVVLHIINDEKISTYELIIMLRLNYLQNSGVRRTMGLQKQGSARTNIA